MIVGGLKKMNNREGAKGAKADAKQVFCGVGILPTEV